jgi:hypothetical protein
LRVYRLKPEVVAYEKVQSKVASDFNKTGLFGGILFFIGVMTSLFYPKPRQKKNLNKTNNKSKHL